MDSFRKTSSSFGVKTSRNYNIMVVGDVSLGKKTFIKESLNNNFEKETIDLFDCFKVSAKIDSSLYQISIFVTNSLGLGLNNEKEYEDILTFVQKRHSDCLQNELKIERERIDKRIHLVLYFFNAYREKRERDITLFSKLEKISNVIPILAKSDQYTEEEIQFYKSIYRLNNIFSSETDDDELLKYNNKISELLPFAVISSEEGKRHKLGKNINIENQEYSDFELLKLVLFRTHLEFFIERTNKIYEEYRRQELSKKSCINLK